MYVSPICFPWTDEGPYCWTPIVPRVSRSSAYWNYAWDLLQKAGCNSAVVLMGSSDRNGWRDSLRIQAPVLAERKLPVLPYFGQASMTPWGWPGDSQDVPDSPIVIAEHLISLLDEIDGVEFVQYEGRPVLGLLSNFAHIRDGAWHPRTLRRVGRELRSYLGATPAWFVDRHAADKLRHDEQINLFTHRDHHLITGRTAAVRPGFWHYRLTDGRFDKRDGHRPWRRSLRTILADPGVEYLFIESVDEEMEGSGILPHHTTPNPPPGTGQTDRWGRSPNKCLKVLKRELRR